MVTVYSKTSMTRTSMARLPWIIRSPFLVPSKFNRKQLFREFFLFYHEIVCVVITIV